MLGRRELLRWGVAAALGGSAACSQSPEQAGGAAQVAGWVEEQMKRLSLAEKVGQLICVWPNVQEGAESLVRSGKAGTLYIDGSVRERPRSGLSAEEVVPLINQLQRDTKLPVLVSNGFAQLGQVIKGVTEFPSNMAMGATRSKEMVYQAGRIMALEARALGVHWPGPGSCDVNTNPKNPVISTRSFGDSPHLVAELATALMKGLQDHGTVAWGYHFPGHGDTGEDSHLELPVIRHGRDRLDQVELVPFKALIEAGVKAICTAHIWYPALEPSENLPATLSRKIVTGLLREELGYQGVIGSDALGMQGVSDHFGTQQAVVMALRAGIDLLLTWPDAETSYHALLEAVQDSAELRARLDESLRRILQLKTWLGLDRRRLVEADRIGQIVGIPEHQQMALDIARKAITLVRGETFMGALPSRSKTLYVVTESNRRRFGVGELPHEEFIASLKKKSSQASFVVISDQVTAKERGSALQEAKSAQAIVAAVFATLPFPNFGLVPERQAQLLGELIGTKPTGILLYGAPYGLAQFGGAEALVCCYDATPGPVEASAELCAGQIQAVGELPVELELA